MEKERTGYTDRIAALGIFQWSQNDLDLTSVLCLTMQHQKAIIVTFALVVVWSLALHFASTKSSNEDSSSVYAGLAHSHVRMQDLEDKFETMESEMKELKARFLSEASTSDKATTGTELEQKVRDLEKQLEQAKQENAELKEENAQLKKDKNNVRRWKKKSNHTRGDPQWLKTHRYLL